MPVKSVKRLDIPDVLLIENFQFSDDRGYFEEVFKESEISKYISCRFVQVNHSYSKKGVLRGLHFQIMPKPQGKLVTVISGRILDVAVDVRRGSPTYKKWVSAEITPGKMIWIPVGFAHGFLALEDSHVLYFVTREFSKEHDSGIAWNDPEINVNWPMTNVIISEKDKKLPLLKDSNANFEYGVDQC
ncbi:dTDP-4-dehydrorhamnose 3,5-epimerase [Acidianus sulfidivorans JP7]|uniref:dTDP-4-dehydrorhamnose 3,5-epimerase n=1 Tax=Acidianus sulfidivorans JP7 TaxID=619593 RepID=A0A2U9IQ39_9CREN|nr:dTDP-4-dehydrorhamnose 3,5-epimerase [Acidianus sulfidivorans]AWR98169.1 dTDP-4-dehydrorhamnose 3,5-epimerase [Acidianus sulfidivorans JP7]